LTFILPPSSKWVRASAREKSAFREALRGRQTAGRYACPRPKSGKFSNSQPDNFQGYWNKKIIDLQISVREANQLDHRFILLAILFLSNNPMLLST